METTAHTSARMSLASVTVEVDDVEAAHRFYAALGVDTRIRLRESEAPSTGFRGFTLALSVTGPATVDGFVAAAVEAGAKVLKPATKSLWGYGGVVQAPDGTIWQVVTSAKKHTGPATREIDEIVLLLGVEDVKATRQFYVGRGLTLAKGFGGKYAEFAAGASGSVKLALYKRRGLAKLLGVPADGAGSHRIVLGSTTDTFTDPDGFVWEASEAAEAVDATE
ncbi:glyoxalase [Streptomyces endophyticus]|uniref:Glyoxalase n=1 Tax=Streptomyces endophyticus TaxID=714166 RepID=A0ABU6F6Q9_9ACTN|nr:glyoxalase [Streptomyces endophyticus]MEB8338517.1 glyoxalase [Streptomyces endophyticus]